MTTLAGAHRLSDTAQNAIERHTNKRRGSIPAAS